MRQYRFASLAAALLLCSAGAAYAAGSDTTGNPGNKSTPSAGGAVKNAPGAESAQDNVMRPIGQWAVGKTVYDRSGDVVGQVKRVEGDKVVVGAGQYLGIGSHDIALDEKQLNQSGSGADMRLITNLSKSELKAQPEAKSNMNGGTTNKR